MKRVNFQSRNGQNITISAVINLASVTQKRRSALRSLGRVAILLHTASW